MRFESLLFHQIHRSSADAERLKIENCPREHFRFRGLGLAPTSGILGLWARESLLARDFNQEIVINHVMRTKALSITFEQSQ